MDIGAGSGDFQPNPIYGDQPQSIRSSFGDNNSNINADGQYPFSNNNAQQQQQQQQPQQPPQPYDTTSQQSSQPAPYGGQQQQAPPQYQSQANGPTAAYHDAGNVNGHTDDPEDVVGQMRQNSNIPEEDDVDYNITPPKQGGYDDDDDGNNGQGLFGNFVVRTIYMAGALCFTSMLSMALWTADPGELGSFGAGYGLCAFAVFMIFFGSIGALIYGIFTHIGRALPGERIVVIATVALYVIGGLFYFFGGCAVAYAWNDLGDAVVYDTTPIAGIFFVETTFVGLHAILAGVDLLRKSILNNKKFRVIIYHVLFLFLAVVAFFSYARTSSVMDNLGADNAGPAFCALFYFIVFIPQIFFLAIYLIPKLKVLAKPCVLLLLAGVFGGCAICLLIGYFILTGTFFGLAGRAYFTGMGFFVLCIGIAMAFDMFFDRFIPKYKDSDAIEASDQNALKDDNNDDSD
eukprot:CAMPEP_0202690130 /NCGR_PEP_ID=MMETSP1385-20130828/5225_1 /ASSEMBLY_ACC=CAM_ASM_000861 /TAXON_ID=933848 /ORGANISM="Elphidium margaritaceum" /LENGTH=459 /DNA_ID=CAMNT_0049345361 /DNA_START=83 /DNA_END=1462 /DNA_ORIENTATION=-